VRFLAVFLANDVRAFVADYLRHLRVALTIGTVTAGARLFVERLTAACFGADRRRSRPGQNSPSNYLTLILYPFIEI
jgi:hypothetical protein